MRIEKIINSGRDPALFVKIYGDEVSVEDQDGNVLETGALDEHAQLVAFAKQRARKVDYDS